MNLTHSQLSDWLFVHDEHAIIIGANDKDRLTVITRLSPKTLPFGLKVIEPGAFNFKASLRKTDYPKASAKHLLDKHGKLILEALITLGIKDPGPVVYQIDEELNLVLSVPEELKDYAYKNDNLADFLQTHTHGDLRELYYAATYNEPKYCYSETHSAAPTLERKQILVTLQDHQMYNKEVLLGTESAGLESLKTYIQVFKKY